MNGVAFPTEPLAIMQILDIFPPIHDEKSPKIHMTSSEIWRILISTDDDSLAQAPSDGDFTVEFSHSSQKIHSITLIRRLSPHLPIV